MDAKYKIAAAIIASACALDALRRYRRRYLPPCDSRHILSTWGPRWVEHFSRDGFHSGLDFALDHGAEVRAAMSGVVEFAGADDDRMSGGGYGIKVDLRHKDGSLTRYAHLTGHRPEIVAGVSVEAGQVIGYAGASGHTKSRPRLHFEIRGPDKLHLNPMELIRW